MTKNTGGSRKKTPPIFLIIIGSGLIIIAAAVVLLIVKDNDSEVRPVGVGPAPKMVSYQAPHLDLVDLSGNPVSLDMLSGQVLLINNWATWCPPCRAEMPILETYYHIHKDDGFTLIGINSGDNQDQVKEFVSQYQLTFPMWLDSSGKALYAFRNNALPSSYVIDRSGIVRLVWVGSVTIDALETYLTPILSD